MPTKLTSTMAPAASVRVGEISSKSRLDKNKKAHQAKPIENQIFKALKKLKKQSLKSKSIRKQNRIERYEIEFIQAKLANRLLNGGSGRKVVFDVGTIQV
jgi:hypothetical protein